MNSSWIYKTRSHYCGCDETGRPIKADCCWINELQQELETTKKQMEEAVGLIKYAINRNLIFESCSENDWDVDCDDWLKETREFLAKLSKEDK